MARFRSRIGQAAATHRRAAAIVTAADTALTGHVPLPRERPELRQLADRLSTAAGQVAPGWLGAGMDAVAPLPVGTDPDPSFVRVGTARLPAPGDRPAPAFPAVVPLGHVAFDAGPDDRRTAAAMQALMLRLLATVPAGSLLVRVVDPEHQVAQPFAALADAGIMTEPATDLAGLSTTLAEAERWADAPPPERRLVLAIAGWPEGAGASDVARTAQLAARARGLHLLVAGWPTGTDREVPLPGGTRVTLGYPYAMVGHPPGGSFAAGAPPGLAVTPGLNAEVVVDPAPPPALIGQVCARLVERALDRAQVTLGELLPDPAARPVDTAGGLSVVIGRAGETPVSLRLGEPTWHWLIGGRAGSGKTTMLHSILYGLVSRYDPEDLAVYLIDPGEDSSAKQPGSFADFAASVPHVRAAGVGTANRARAALHEVAARVAQRDGPAHTVCLVDRCHELRDDPAQALLRSLAGSERERGLHLVLAGEDVPDPALAHQFRLRLALPGALVLDAANDATAGLALGSAVVNTAAGLGGPRGATRVHEQLVRLPDPYADPVALAGLRHRLLTEQVAT